MKFIKPKAIFYEDYKENDPYKDLIGVRIYEKNGAYPPDNLKTSDELKKRYEELTSYAYNNRDKEVGELISSQGNFLRKIKLHECLSLYNFGSESYIEEKLYYKPEKAWVRYEVYKGFKFNNYGSYLTDWFTSEEREVFNAPVPQQLDDEGYITMVEDDKTYITVNYTHYGLIQQESKIVYVSKNGRYIKYKGKNYYIEES